MLFRSLSYSKFEYSNLRISKSEIEINETINLSVTVKNIGEYEGDETVELYLKDVDATVVIPKYQLKGIKKVCLKPSEEKEVSFELTSRQMALINDEGKCILEPGLFEVFVGGSQPDKRSKELTGDCMQKSTFNVKGESIVLEY